MVFWRTGSHNCEEISVKEIDKADNNR